MKSRLCVLLLLVAAMVMQGCQAYPQDYNCKGSSWKGGEPFQRMLVDKFTAAKTECVIEGVPDKFSPGKKYTIKVISKDALSHKLAVEQGTLVGASVSAVSLEGSKSKTQSDKCGYSPTKQKVSAYVWTAPTSGAESFYALCGQFVGPMYVAPAITIKNALESEYPDAFASLA